MGAYAIAGYQEARSSRSPTPISVPYCMVLLGDSYSAGNAAGDYYGDDKSAYRSRNNWAHRHVDWVNTQNVSATLTALPV